MKNVMGLLRPVVGVAGVSSPLEVGADRAGGAAGALAAMLVAAGCEVENAGAVGSAAAARQAGRRFAEKHVAAVALVSASWFEDYLAIDLLEECRSAALLWSLPGMETGALCGVQQLTAILRPLGWAYEAVFGAVEAGAAFERGLEFVRAAGLVYSLRRSRIGMAGHRVRGMTETAANEIALKRAIGARVSPLDLPGLLKRAGEIGDGAAAELWRSVRGRAGACTVSDAAGLDSVKVYMALKEAVAAEELDAVTVGCYPHLMGRVCLAASLLADEGVPMACEGDVNGAVGQLMLQRLTGEATHHTDWLEPMADGSVVLTHCGSGSFSLAERCEAVSLSPVRLMGRGVCAMFPSRPGQVTLLNLMPMGDGYQVAMLEGEAVSTEMVFPGNPLRVRFSRPVGELIDWIHREGVGHHWSAGYGYVGGAIRQWARIAGGAVRLIEFV